MHVETVHSEQRGGPAVLSNEPPLSLPTANQATQALALIPDVLARRPGKVEGRSARPLLVLPGLSQLIVGPDLIPHLTPVPIGGGSDGLIVEPVSQGRRHHLLLVDARRHPRRGDTELNGLPAPRVVSYRRPSRTHTPR